MFACAEASSKKSFPAMLPWQKRATIFHRAWTRKTGTSAHSPKPLLPALVQILVGDFSFGFWEGNVAGNLPGILPDFSDPQTKGSKTSGKTSEHFS